MAAAFSYVAAASANLTSVTHAPTTLTGLIVMNTSANPRFVRLYNKATAPVPASDVPVLRFPLPAGDGLVLPLAISLWFSAGLAFDITGAAADSDTTVVVAGDVTINLFYE